MSSSQGQRRPEQPAAAEPARGHPADEPTRVSDGPGGAANQPRPHIDGYEIHEELHRGGQGVVYRATQLAFKREVALKVLLEGPFAGETSRVRFEREIELAASLQHPNIVTILDSGTTDGRCYFAMEYVDGQRLDAYLRDRQPDLAQTLALLRQIAETVHFAHQRGVIHRDLKPSNILIDSAGQPRILDFGLAKATADADPQKTTVRMVSTTGQVIGTLAYMSPEQAAGSADVDIRSDVYSLGVIAYEALLQATPYPVDGPLGEVLQRIARDEPIRPRAMRSSARFGKQIDDELETILLKSLEKDPSRRYQTALDLARDLRHYLLGEPIEAKRASGLYMLKKTLRRYRWQAATAGLLLVSLIAFAVTFAVQWRSERELRAKAAAAAEVARQKEQLAAEAEAREREARERAERNEKAAIDAAERAREALVRQMVQRGNLAWVSGDLGVARDSYWEAYLDGADKAAAVWALRQYYLDSGDSGSVQLFHQAFGPTALSPDGRLAATCDAPHGVSLRATDSGAAIHWVRTPDAVVAVSVSNDGRFAACGDGWAGVWSKASHAPLVEVQWAGDFEPSWIREIDGGAALLLAGENTIALFDAAEGKLRARGVLHGPRLGEPLLTGDGARLYVPTRAGVEMAPLYGDEALRSSVWRPGAARALAPLDEDRVAVLLDDAVVAGPLDAQSADAWTTLVQLSSRYDLLRANDAGSQLVVASRAGRVAAFDQGRELFAWQASSEGLLDIHLEKEAPAVVTLAADGALTRWVAPEHAQERRTIFHRPVARWALSEKAAAVLMATRQGEVFAYAPEIQPAPIAIDLPGLWRAFGAQGADDISLAIDEAGDTALIASGGRVWQRELDRERTRPLRARSARGLPTAAVALAFDGRVGALYQRSEARDRQVIAFVPLEPPNASRTPALPRSAWRPTPFVGSTIREIRFLPHTYTLVVTRSNGAIIMLDPPLNASAESLRDRTSPWMELESPAYRIACSRDAEWLAAACDDGFVRVLDVLNVKEVGRFAVRRRVDALSFDPRGDVLLVRSDDGDIELRDMQTLERLLSWEFSAGGGSALAAWIGAGDLALTESRGVELIEFDTIDERIRRGESFALARECLRRADEGDLEGAWHSAALLRIVDADAGAEAQRAVLDRALRRRGRHIPDEWLDSTEMDRSALLRLSHAAYAGGRIETAAALLDAAGAAAVSDTDVYTRWRAAECALLVDDLPRAITALREVASDGRLLARDHARVQLELLAAHVLIEDFESAREHLAAIQRIGRRVRGDETAGVMAAMVVGRYLLGDQTEAQVATALGAFLNMFKEQWLAYRDDVEFFAGELARHRGDFETAARRYQLCIDLAVDAWPADWARHRLRQISAKINEQVRQ